MTLPHAIEWNDGTKRISAPLDTIQLDYIMRNMGRIVEDVEGNKYVIWDLLPVIDLKTNEVCAFRFETQAFHPATCTKFLRGAQ